MNVSSGARLKPTAQNVKGVFTLLNYTAGVVISYVTKKKRRKTDLVHESTQISPRGMELLLFLLNFSFFDHFFMIYLSAPFKKKKPHRHTFNPTCVCVGEREIQTCCLFLSQDSCHFVNQEVKCITMWVYIHVCVFVFQLFGDWEAQVRRIMKMISGGGLSITGSHSLCGDYLYSGHTVMLTLTYLFIKECKCVHTPTPTKCAIWW